jgi:murein DD-endopeptidase MepM/ murein hydrolase activator NlpD
MIPRAESGHPGAFGVERLHHFHEGIDLDTEPHGPVFAVETGTVLTIRQFTGSALGQSWWNDTDAIFVKGESGIVVYGEINASVHVGDIVRPGQEIARVVRILKKDKGRPMDMLHLELRDANHIQALSRFDWAKHLARPSWLMDPTPYLLAI